MGRASHTRGPVWQACPVTAGTTVKGTYHHDCPDTCAWEVTVRDGRGANALTNPGLGRRLSSAAFHDTLVEVERLVVREGE